MSNSFFVDVSPTNSTWDEWSGAIGYVLGAELLPSVSEENWKQFANVLQESPLLNAYGLPDTDAFNSWQEWAENLSTVSNGNGRAV